MYGDIKTEKDNVYWHKSPIFLEDADIEKVFVSKRISSNKKTISTLLVTSMMFIKLSHYI